jgi:hypothetical protein
VPVYKLPTDGHNVTAVVFRTGQPARIDDYAKAAASGSLSGTTASAEQTRLAARVL